MILSRTPRIALTLTAGTVAVWAVLNAILSHVAHAAADVPPAPAPGWTLAEVLLLIGVLLFAARQAVDGLRAVLHFVAPRTENTWDDEAATVLDGLHDRITALEALLPRTTVPVDPGVVTSAVKLAPAPRNPQSGRVGAGLLATLALGSVLVGAVVGFAAVGCATLKDAPAVAESAIVDCVKADQQPITALVVQLAADALNFVLGGGVVDWSALESAAWAQGKVTGGCALAEFVHGVSGKAGASAAHVSQVDPARAALERLRVRAGGVQWRTAAGVL